MTGHALRLAAGDSVATSAEPNAEDPWQALQLCRDVVFANAIAGELAEVPLLTAEEVADFHSRRLAGDVEGAVAVARVARERKDARAGFVRDASRWSLQDVLAAAERVETGVQAALWAAGGPGATVADQRYARALWDAQSQANRAVVARASGTDAKTSRQKAAGDRPALTVCCGRRMQRLPVQELQKHAPDLLEHFGENIVPRGSGDHCGVIILDGTATNRGPKKYCERCRGRVGNTMNHGFAKRALAVLKASRRPR